MSKRDCKHVFGTDGFHSNRFCKKCFKDEADCLPPEHTDYELTPEDITRAYHDIPEDVEVKADASYVIDRGKRIIKAYQAKVLRIQTDRREEISLDDVEEMSHYGGIRDWVIRLKSGREIELSAGIIQEIMKHENLEKYEPDRNGQEG